MRYFTVWYNDEDGEKRHIIFKAANRHHARMLAIDMYDIPEKSIIKWGISTDEEIKEVTD
jgi:hypothetical protein